MVGDPEVMRPCREEIETCRLDNFCIARHSGRTAE
jgi:hypothetical protein